MDTNTYEQFELNGELIGYPKVFLQDGMMVTVEKYEDEPLAVTLPDTVVMEIVECEPVVKGQTASSSYKPKLENGERVMILILCRNPCCIKNGRWIIHRKSKD